MIIHFNCGELMRQFPSSRAAYVVDDKIEAVPLMANLNSSDYLWGVRQDVREAPTGDFDDVAFEEFKKQLKLYLKANA